LPDYHYRTLKNSCKMAILKIRASSLVETIVASILIMIVFVIASLTLNNLFRGVIKNDTTQLDYRVKELRYLFQNDKLELPFFEENNMWDIAIEASENNFRLEALHKASNEIFITKLIEE